MPNEYVCKVLDDIESGDVLLFDRNCLKMSNIFGIGICGYAKLASHFDHVAIVLKLDKGLVPESSTIRKAIKEESPRHLYVLEANLGGVTLRSLEARLDQTSSNCVAVRRLLNITRDEKFHRNFFAEVEGLMNFKYRSKIADLLLLMEPPDKTERREAARQAALQKSNSEECNSESKAVCESVFALDGTFDLIRDKGLVCSELVAKCLQSIGFLAPYPTSAMYLPNDFDITKSHFRLVFNRPEYGLGEVIYLSGKESDIALNVEGIRRDFGNNRQDNSIQTNHTVYEPFHQDARSQVGPSILAIGHTYAVATLLTAPLVTKQIQQQLCHATFIRGNMLSFALCSSFRIMGGAYLHTFLINVFDHKIPFSSKYLDTTHPYCDLILRGGALGVLASILTLPMESANLRFHFNPVTQWWRIQLHHAISALAVTILLVSPYCGPHCWPLYQEAILPLMSPLAPSIFRPSIRSVEVERSDKDRFEEKKISVVLSIGLFFLTQYALYPFETMRLRYMTLGSVKRRGLFMGSRYYFARAAAVFPLSYYSLYSSH